jgi:uncharacterized membrane protein YgdD (TMEM256/DUF423 family)
MMTNGRRAETKTKTKTKTETAMGMAERLGLVFAGLNGAVSVAAGAWASHGLAGQERAQELVRTAVQFEATHALALIAAVLLAQRATGRTRGVFRLAGLLFAVGILAFCGSLYALGFFGVRPVPMGAPVGGSAFILGWLALAVAGAFVRGERP